MIPNDRRITVAASVTLDTLSVSLFASVMGLAALSIAWRAAATQLPPAQLPAGIFGVVAVIGFLALAAGYALKAIRHFAAVRDEFAHPTTRSFFGMPLICLLLLSSVVAPVSYAVAKASWYVGTAGMLVFSWSVVSHWLANPQQRATVTTAWLIVAVGILDIPLAMPTFELQLEDGFALVCVVVGLLLAAMLYSVIVPRYLFEPPPAAGQTPTLLIAVAPLAVGFSSYVTATGSVDLFAGALLIAAAIRLFGLLVPIGRYLIRSPFSLSWWATGFPIAATAGASVRCALATQQASSIVLALALLVLATAWISGLLLRTIVHLLAAIVQKAAAKGVGA